MSSIPRQNRVLHEVRNPQPIHISEKSAFRPCDGELVVFIKSVGWAFLVKSIIRFCLPRVGLRMMERVSVERAWEFQAAGVMLVLLAALLGYGVSIS